MINPTLAGPPPLELHPPSGESADNMSFWDDWLLEVNITGVGVGDGSGVGNWLGNGTGVKVGTGV